MLTFKVARFFEVSPDEVENWRNCDYLDRQEYMFVMQDIEEQHLAKEG
jgi:hypothetical protein